MPPLTTLTSNERTVMKLMTKAILYTLAEQSCKRFNGLGNARSQLW